MGADDAKKKKNSLHTFSEKAKSAASTFWKKLEHKRRPPAGIQSKDTLFNGTAAEHKLYNVSHTWASMVKTKLDFFNRKVNTSDHGSRLFGHVTHKLSKLSAKFNPFSAKPRDKKRQ